MAKEYRVGIMSIYYVIKKAKKKPSFLNELIEKRDNNSTHRKAIGAVITQMNNDNKIIDSVNRL